MSSHLRDQSPRDVSAVQAHRQARPRAIDGAARLSKEDAKRRAAVLKHLGRAIAYAERAMREAMYNRRGRASGCVERARFEIGEASAWLYQWQRWGGR